MPVSYPISVSMMTVLETDFKGQVAIFLLVAFVIFGTVLGVKQGWAFIKRHSAYRSTNY